MFPQDEDKTPPFELEALEGALMIATGADTLLQAWYSESGEIIHLRWPKMANG